MTNAARSTLAIAILSSLAVSCSRDGLTSNSPRDAAGDHQADASNPFCSDNGRTYSIGETFKRDCNTCTCTETGMSCTMLLCPLPGGTGGMAGAGGAGGIPGLGGSPTGTGGAKPSPDAKPFVCIEGGRSYAISESFAMDCNTCRCTASGFACTGMICPPDAGPTLPPDAADKCVLRVNLTFGYDGGMVAYSDVNRLTTSTFTITRTYSTWTGQDRPAPTTCSPSLPACDGAPDAVTVATINTDLGDPEVLALWTLPKSPVPLFGTDPRPVDGTVFSIALDDGRKVLVGGQCASPIMSSCRYIPKGLLRLTQDLQILTKNMVSDPVCKGL
jgi:hypothetical protein